MIRVLYYCQENKTTREIDPVTLPAACGDVPEGDCFWIDLQDASMEEVEQVLGRFLAVHPLTREDATRMRRLPDQGAHLPKVEEFDDYLFVIVNPLPASICEPGRGRWKRDQLSAILTEKVLVTLHDGETPCVMEVRRHLSQRPDLLHRGPDYVFHLLLDAMVDEYAPVVERFAAQLARLETLIFEKPATAVLTKLLHLKRRVLFLRKTLTLEREVLARLVRNEFSLVTEQEIHYYRNVYDHLVRYTELVEGAREMVTDLMQLHLASTSNKLNEIMKVLTMISTVILPMTLVVGYYGMNFRHIEELNWEWGHWYALAAIGAIGLAALGLFRWKRWV